MKKFPYPPKFGANPAYGLGLPPLDRHLVRAPMTPYVKKKLSDVIKRYDNKLLARMEVSAEYMRLLDTLWDAFFPMLTDYDKEEVAPVTCAKSMWKPTHTDLDELSQQIYPNDFTYSDELISSIVKYYLPRKSKKPIKLSLPRGKNVGSPYVISGANRKLSDVFLIVSAIIALGAEAKGWTLEELTKFIESYHGPCMTIWASRTQDTGKQMPIVTGHTATWSTNFEPRVRGIFISPKFHVVMNRRPVKEFANTIFESNLHTQSRKDIQTRMDFWKQNKWLIFAVDYSKYERHIGGERAKSIIKVISGFCGNRAGENIMTEFSLPILMFGRSGAFTLPGGNILASGLSATSLIGNVGNDLNTSQALSYILGIKPEEVFLKLQSEKDKDIGGLLFGDDAVIAFSPTCAANYGSRDDLQSKLKEAYAKTKMTIDEEPVVKFLGHVYDSQVFKGTYDKGMATWRAVQQTFFPERLKDFPFSTIGYIARLEMLGDRAEPFHRTMQRFWDVTRYGPPFTFGARIKRLEALIPEIERHADKISQLDDILQSVYHGLAEEGGEIGSELDQFLGLTALVIDNPILQLKEMGISRLSLDNLSQLLKGDFSVYRMTISHLVDELKLNWRHHDVVY